MGRESEDRLYSYIHQLNSGSPHPTEYGKLELSRSRRTSCACRRAQWRGRGRSSSGGPCRATSACRWSTRGRQRPSAHAALLDCAACGAPSVSGLPLKRSVVTAAAAPASARRTAGVVFPAPQRTGYAPLLRTSYNCASSPSCRTSWRCQLWRLAWPVTCYGGRVGRCISERVYCIPRPLASSLLKSMARHSVCFVLLFSALSLASMAGCIPLRTSPPVVVSCLRDPSKRRSSVAGGVVL